MMTAGRDVGTLLHICISSNLRPIIRVRRVKFPLPLTRANVMPAQKEIYVGGRRRAAKACDRCVTPLY